MSCGCNVPKGSFSTEQNTWTAQSSLSMQESQPRQEQENYRSKEKFVQDLRCCGPTPYNNLDQTWAPQKDYSWN
jgi:hypothetical protein